MSEPTTVFSALPEGWISEQGDVIVECVFIICMFGENGKGKLQVILKDLRGSNKRWQSGEGG